MEALTPSLEDYLEAMWTLSLKDKVMRVRDIAASLGVTTPSVVGAIKSLVAKNLARHERYGYVELTNQGRAKAREVEERHRFLFSLLHDLFGIDRETAYQEACKIEHHLSNESVTRIKRFVQFFEEHQEEKGLLASRLEKNTKKGGNACDEKEERNDHPGRPRTRGEGTRRQGQRNGKPEEEASGHGNDSRDRGSAKKDRPTGGPCGRFDQRVSPVFEEGRSGRYIDYKR